ncbi:type II toxin-antitoxin system PemK/MazF family toxin [Methylolobus aquaticus]|nr:type II toxin-antitoxin system PemK/MazF family toxin [Methylolobus aquaticus]
MRRGEVWWVEFAGTVGSEIRKRRPAIIVSNDAANRYLGRVQVVPLTSNTAKLYPGEARVTLKGHVSKAMADQVTTADKARLSERLSSLSVEDMRLVEDALRLQLGL